MTTPATGPQSDLCRMIPTNISEDYSHIVLVTGSRTWSDEGAMRATFNQLWQCWSPRSVTRPLLISGHCPDGADAMAEYLWYGRGLEVLRMPADWSAGRGAGYVRNQKMVDAAQVLRQAGAQVASAAFLDPCIRARCPQRDRQQLMPDHPGHFSHGTVHCRSRALAADIEVLDVPSLGTRRS